MLYYNNQSQSTTTRPTPSHYGSTPSISEYETIPDHRSFSSWSHPWSEYAVNRCFCADDKHLGFTFRYNLTLDNGQWYAGTWNDQEPRSDALYGAHSVRCDDDGKGCYDIPDYSNYKVVQSADPRNFRRYCIRPDDNKICFMNDQWMFNGIKGTLRRGKATTTNRKLLTECDDECKHNWSDDPDSAISVCSYTWTVHDNNYGKLIPADMYPVKNGDLKHDSQRLTSCLAFDATDFSFP